MGQGVPSASLPFWQIGVALVENRLDFFFRSDRAARYLGQSMDRGTAPVLELDLFVRDKLS